MEKGDLQRFRNECVAAHNFYRAGHGTAPLCWSSRLAESAQNWADYLASSVGGSLRYSTDKDIGENLACLWGSELNGQKVTRIWYEEGKYFDYNKPRVNSRTRSFCQVVWEGTRELGAGAAVTKHGKQIIVARYFPAVNKRDVTRNVKKARSTRDNEQPLAYDTRWSRLYVGLKEFHEECLAAHNEYRLRHGAAALQWSAELAWEAQQWAENLARSGELRHNDDDTVGENLAGMAGGELTGREATGMWYDEIEDYNFENPGYSENTSNFSQIVWVASESLGVGRALHDDLCVVVAFYEPPGNMEGSFGDNVLRMGSAVRQRKSKEPRGFVPPTPDLESFRLEMLVTHNYFRARHGSPPLVFSGVLTDEAQYWAERLLVTGAMESLDNSRIGISVAVLDKSQVSGVKVSELWYKEILNYDFDSPGFSNETLNFSQLVWQSSRKLGLGKATGVDGVTVIVARYEPVGNIDGLFVQNVRRRGHERGSCEPMIFHVEYRYRVRADSKSTTSFMSWEHEDAPTFGELQTDTVRTSSEAPQGTGLNRAKFLLNRLIEDLDRCRNSCYLSPPLSMAASLSWSDLDEFDENENILHRAHDQEVSNNLTVSDHFTRLVWIDPNSPTLQRKGVVEKPAQDDNGEQDEDEEKEDPRTAYEQDNTLEAADLTCVAEEPLLDTEEGELEEADLFSDPEDDLHQRFSEVRRSLSLDSEGTEPDMQRGSVLSKVAFFEMFQQGMETQSPSHSQTLLRRSVIQEELEELASLPKRSPSPQEEEVGREEEVMGEHECQLEFDDVFPAHREGDEEDVHLDEDTFDDEGEDEEESLVSVSETEDVLDFPDYDTRPDGPQDLEFEVVLSVTHEFSDKEQPAMEINDVYHEDISQEHSDVTEEEDQRLSSLTNVFLPTNLSTDSEFQITDNFRLCKDESPYLVEDAPDNSREERFKSSEAVIDEPRDSFQRTTDPEFCFATSKQEKVEIRMREILALEGLSFVEVSEDASDESCDFKETVEGKLVENIVNSERRREPDYERTPVEETCEATFREAVESEIDFEALFGKLHGDCDETEKTNVEQESDTVIVPSETVQVLSRDREGEVAAKLARLSADLGLTPITDDDDLKEEREAELEVTLDYQSTTSIPAHNESSSESAHEATIQAVWKSAKDLEEPQMRLDSLTPEDNAEHRCVALPRNYDQERTKALEETSLELNLVFSSPDEIIPSEEHVEPLDYHQASKSTTASEQPEIVEHIDAETHPVVHTKINYEDIFRSLEDENAESADEISETEHFEDTTRESTSQDEASRASLHIEKDTTVDQVFLSRCLPTSSEYISPESKQLEPVEETVEVRQVEKQRPASLYMEESCEVEEVVVDSPTSPRHISGEGLSLDRIEMASEEKVIAETNLVLLIHDEHESVNEINTETSIRHHIAGKTKNQELFDEITEETISDSNVRASLYRDEDVAVEDVSPTVPSVRTHLSNECESVQSFKEPEMVEQTEEENRSSLYMEENVFVDSVKYREAENSLHISSETCSSDMTEEVLEQHEDVQHASLVMHEETVVDVTTRSTSSPLYIIGDSASGKSFEEIYEDVFDEVERRASLSEEEDSIIHEVVPDAPSSPNHLVEEHKNVEPFENIDKELGKESKRASLFLEEEKDIVNAQTDSPSSPKHIAMESRNCETYHEMEEESIEESNRASLLRTHAIEDEEITFMPSPPKHLAGESVNMENFGEVEEEPTAEKKTSLSLEEKFSVEELKHSQTSVPIHIAGQDVCMTEFEEIPKEAAAPLELAQEFEESLEEVSYDDAIDPNNHIAGEVTNRKLITDEDDSPESDYGEQFEEFENTYRTQGLMGPAQSAHISGEIDNVVSCDEVMEDASRVEESVEYEDSLQLVTTTNMEDTNQSSLHVAVELSNIEAREESSEEEKQEEEVSPEEIEEALERATTIVLKSPHSLLSMAAAALEHKIDAAQQASEVVETQSEVSQQHNEEERLEVPVIFVNIADEESNNEEESACCVAEEPNIETEIQEQYDESPVQCKTEQTPVSESHVAAEFCISEFSSERHDVEKKTDLAEPFEESEEGSFSELMSESSSSPLHVSSELKDFQDYETIGEDSSTETYHATTLDETKFVSEKSFSKGMPLLYITEELSTQAMYDESVLNEKSITIETTEAYNEEEKPLERETNIFIAETPLQTAAEFSDSDYNYGVGEEDYSSEREFCEAFEEKEESSGKVSLFQGVGEPTGSVSENGLSDSQIAEEGNRISDETDNAHNFSTQELVYVHHRAKDVERDSIVYEEEIEEKGFTHQMETFTTVSQNEHRSVEVKSNFRVIETGESQGGENVFTGGEEQQMKTSHAIEETVQVISSKTTSQASSTNSHFAAASEEIHYKADKNSEGILQEELKKVQEVSFTSTKQTTRQTSWEKKENDQHFETGDQLSEGILEREVQDQETKKNEKLLSEDETEVRLLKGELLKSKAAEQQESLANPQLTVSKFVKRFVVHSGAKDVQEVHQIVRQEDVTVILKDDEASLEEESAEDHFEEEIDIMRMDEALSEEEFRGEGVENVDRNNSRLSKTDSADGMDRWNQEEGRQPLEDEQKKPLYEEEVDVSEVQPIYEEEVEMQRVKKKEDAYPSETEEEVISRPTFEEIEIAAYVSTIQAEEGSFKNQTADNMQLRPKSAKLEEELEVSTRQEVEEEGSEDFEPEGHSVAAVEMQRVKQKDAYPSETEDNVVSTPSFEEVIKMATYGSTIQAEEGSFESQSADNMQLTPKSAEFEEELDVATLQDVQEEGSEDFEPEGHSVAAVFEEEVEISASVEECKEPLFVSDDERKTVYYMESSEHFVEEGHVVENRATRRQPLDLSQVDLYEDERAATRYYVELSSTESLERAYGEVQEEASFTEKYVRQGDPLEENLEEFILVRYGDEFESSGEEDLSEQREIYVIPEEDNDGENSNLVKEELETEKEPLAESFYEREDEDVGLEEIRESPEFEIDDSPEDELDEEEQRQLEEYERLESFVILEEKLSQVESDEDCGDENAGFRGEERDENVFHSDVHSSSEETLHEDELGETMTTSSIRQAAVSADTESKEDKNADYQSTVTHQELPEDSSPVKDDELKGLEGAADSAGDDVSRKVSKELQTLSSQKGIPSDEGHQENVGATRESAEKGAHPEFKRVKDEENEPNLSSDSSGEQSISSEGSQSSTASVDLEGLDDFEEDCFLQHNLYRRQHRCKPLKWSDELAAGAKEWAEYLASVNSLERCEGKEFGQNLAIAQGIYLSGSEVVDIWYKESTDYNFDVPAFNAKCGNFTQVVWTSSREFGAGKAVADDGTQFVVAWYKPSGNIVGEFRDNVKPPKDSSSRVRRRRSSARRRSQSGIPPVTPAEREKFKTECVISHNYYRTFHNAPPLRWSPLLATEAQNYADRLVKTGSLSHSGQKDHGENLAYTWDSPLSARGAVDLWYDEVQDYDFDSPGYTSDTGHFTQLVWVGTEEFGMGMAAAPDGRHVAVGRYYPPGNIVGQFRENVRPREIAGIP
ncbi:titin-like isoform X2 [Stylophora pistillata]|uniref:titin-like isoform X2 n=1 Tax=Stylophora pistillata TaxID=50429 RepID=UPI000C057C25|nr:titin-like isoform X2 [Stylophora pistillata]